MNNFKIIYKILKALQGAFETGELDPSRISQGTLGISKEHLTNILVLLKEQDLVKGVIVAQYVDGETFIDTSSIKITYSGLEFLEENGMMRKVGNALKGIVDVVS